MTATGTATSPSGAATWATANETAMRARVALSAARLRLALDERQQPAAAGTPEAERCHHQRELASALDAVAAAEAAMPVLSAFGQISALFGLSAFEAELLALCAAVELDAEVARRCEQAGGAPVPTFGLALALLPEAHWSALAPTRPLRHWQLVELGPGERLTARIVTIDERVLHELLGVPTIDRRLVDLVRPRPVGPDDRTYTALASAGAAPWRDGPTTGWPVVQLVGPAGGGREDAAAATAAAAGLDVMDLHLTDAVLAGPDVAVLARLCAREAALAGAALVVDGDRLTDARLLDPFLRAYDGPLVLLGRTPTAGAALGGRSHRFDVAALTVAQRAERWRRAVPVGDDDVDAPDGVGGVDDGMISALAERFALGPAQIAAAAERAAGEPLLAAGLWDAARAQARPVLEPLARRRISSAGWSDLVLPEEQLDVLHQLAAQVRQRRRVLDDWGFAAGMRGLGTTALFAGPSGTGKTTAAEVIANELDLDLYCVDLAMVVDKYIGETEKHLSAIFDAAESGGVVLLFDEADALFGKRSEVRDSHDRYANVEVAYLLQRVEEYRGLAILTTNARNAVDPAFLRRLRFVVTFPFPDVAQRTELWRRAFPPTTPTAGIDPARLARLNVAGGSIRNIALNAAFLAADEDAAVGPTHVVRAARAEYAKLDRPLTDTELRGLT